MTGNFKTRLTDKELANLAELYAHFIAEGSPGGDHWNLLFNHMANMAQWLYKLYKPGQKRYTLRMNQPQAIAFYQMWQMVDISGWVCAGVIVARIIGELDQLHKSQALKNQYT